VYAHCHLTRKRPLLGRVWAGSRERFLSLFGNGSNRNWEWGLLGRDSPEREQRYIPGLIYERLAGKRPHKMYLFINFGGKLTWKKNTN
jgi:hypothetical protein